MFKRRWPWRKARKYDSAAWEEQLAVEQLQRVYDNLGWTGLGGQCRQRNIDQLTARIRELQGKQHSEVTILDVACFTGDYFGRLLKQDALDGRFQYTGVDVTPAYVAKAIARWRGHDKVQFKQGSAFDLPFADNTFDIVFNSGMLIHVDNVAGCLREFARVARSYVMVETQVNPGQQDDFVDENKSGPKFLDRIYRPDYIRNLLSTFATIVEQTSVPDTVHQSILFVAVPR